MTTQIANASGVSVSAAQKITDAFGTTMGKSEESAGQLSTAFAGVAGQLKTTEGKALDAGQALSFMKTATDLAEASGTSLTSATADLSNVLQSYQIKVSGTAKASNDLYEASLATGSSIDSVSSALDRIKTRLGAMTPPLSQMSSLLVDLAAHGESGRASVQAPTRFLHMIMSGTQADLFKAFVTANTAVDASNLKQQQLGITVLNSNHQFVGFGSVIAQLNQQIVGMSTAQATAKLSADGFGTSAGKLLSIVQAGPAAYAAATAAINTHNAVVAAAAKQQATLQGEWQTALATIKDLAEQLGTLLIPVFTTLGGVVASVAGWFDKNKTVAEALGIVVAGVLSLAVGVFVEQKVASLITGVQTMIDDFGELATT